ncbi:MAG: LTA synthase family protein, partial [Clostridia bacterium]
MIKNLKKKFTKYNYIIIPIIIAIFIELLAITYTECFPFLTNPFYTLLILVFFVALVLIIPNKKIQVIVSGLLLSAQVALNTLFIFLFDTNGTVFEWAMYNQRTDAVGTLEAFDLKYGFIFLGLILIILYVYFMFKKQISNDKNSKKRNIVLSVIIVLSLLIIILLPSLETTGNNAYTLKLYDRSSNNYQRIGIVANGVYQLIKGSPNVDIKDVNKVDKFIYKDKVATSKYNQISKDNNLILILVESFEWYPFTKYPNVSEKLYPNITRLLNNGIYASNYYQKEKTDVSEALSILGNYPTGQYVNYDFYDNEVPFSLPNLLKNTYPKIVMNSYHANYGEFYNRYELHKKWGFNQLYGIDEMKKFGVKDNWNHKLGERNLDSITFDKMKSEMFPLNDQFFSFILSFSMHGYYGKRENLKDYYKILDSYNILKNTDNINDEYLKTYMATLMDFDKAMGIMLDYLEKNNILDTSTIILYADHNTYYNKLSNYAKGIEEKYNSELFHLPFIIYDEKLTKAYKESNGTNKLTKFITASDIVPTVIDLFGLDGWENLYFGHSILTDKESIIYSRNYGFFMTDKFMGYSLNNPL